MVSINGWRFLCQGSLWLPNSSLDRARWLVTPIRTAPHFQTIFCYLFPAVALAGDSKSDPKLIVQLAPGWMPSLSRGLYCDDGEIKTDFMEDFFRVWTPLKRCLGLLDNTEAEEQELGCASDPNQGGHAEDEKATREALQKHLIRLSECPEIIQEAVSDDTDPVEFFERLSKIFRRRRQNEA